MPGTVYRGSMNPATDSLDRGSSGSAQPPDRGTAPALITMSGVSKSYGSTLALADFDITVTSGEIIGLLGENGAGKTTAMRTLLGYLFADAGEVSVGGGSPLDPDIRSRVGYLPGDFRLGSRQKVRDVLAAYNRLRGGQCGPRIGALADALDLELDRRFLQLSKGNRQKVGVVQALMHDPDVLVLDEPTSGLDPIAQRTVLTLVDARRDAGAAVLFSSHILSEVEDIADSVVILRQGRIVAEGTTAELSARALQTIDVVLATAPDEPVQAALAGLTDIQVTSLEGHKLSLSVVGSAAEALRILAPLGIVRIDTGRHDLDDVFYGYYSGGATS